MYFSVAAIFLFAASGLAIPAGNGTCIENMRFNDCGSACPRTCDDPEPTCTKQCVPGCQCVDPMVMNQIGVCVMREACPVPYPVE